MILMNDRTLNAFKAQNNFSLNADADFTIIDYSAWAQGTVGKGPDVVMWSDMKGAFAGASVSATDISWNGDKNKAYYNQTVSAQDVLSGKVTSPQANQLQTEMPS